MKKEIFSLNNLKKGKRKTKFPFIFLFIVISLVMGAAGGFLATNFYWEKNLYQLLDRGSTVIQKETTKYVPQTTEEQKIISAVESTAPAVVSIIITKEVPLFETYYINPFGDDWPFNIEIPQYREKGTETQKVGGGTGFIISKDGMVLTNKHVILEEDVEYTVYTSDGERYPVKILAKDPFYDLAVLQIDQSGLSSKKEFPVVKLGSSENLQIGQSVIAIGNALAEFQNTVSVGVISGLGRTITATGGNFAETLEDIIQTDAAINPGNSGGPLLNLAGEVIGINVARSYTGDNIGFALPIDRAKKAIKQVQSIGEIVYPFLGVYYTIITKDLQQEFDLSVDYGAWVGRDASGGETDEAVVEGTPADEVGIKADDIILEIGGEKVTLENTLAKIIQQHEPGDQVALKVLRDGKNKYFTVTLGKRTGSE